MSEGHGSRYDAKCERKAEKVQVMTQGVFMCDTSAVGDIRETLTLAKAAGTIGDFYIGRSHDGKTELAISPVPYQEKAMPEVTECPIDMKPIVNGERSRTYMFATEYGKQEITVKNVTAICVRPSGSHRLETAKGTKYIIPGGWLALEVDADQWSL